MIVSVVDSVKRIKGLFSLFLFFMVRFRRIGVNPEPGWRDSETRTASAFRLRLANFPLMGRAGGPSWPRCPLRATAVNMMRALEAHVNMERGVDMGEGGNGVPITSDQPVAAAKRACG